jgi:peroxiredoxin
MRRLFFSILISIVFVMITDAQTDSTTLLNNGDLVPSFKCKTIDGKTIDISKLRGKVIMINFFATWCPPCNLELPVLQSDIWDIHKNDPSFVLIILGREHNEKEVTDFVKSKNFTMPFAADPDRDIYKLFATQFIPRNVIIDRDGRIIYQNRGYAKEEFEEIKKIIAEKLK